MATSEELRAEIRELISARQLDGIVGLADRFSPAELADIIHEFEPGEIEILL